MPLPEPAQRKLIHTRKITCEGFVREDGLIDIEACLVDTKPFDFANKDRGGVIRAGEALHGLSLRITIDRKMIIRDAQASMDDTPYHYCKTIAPVFKQLVGVQIKPGFRAKLRNIMGGIKGCTHLTELMTPVATTAFQTIASIDLNDTHEDNEDTRSRHARFILNTCHTHASNSPVVKEHWPEHYKEMENPSGS